MRLCAGVAKGEAVPIRPAVMQDAAGIASVHVESWRSSYQGIFPANFLASLSVERREAYWRQQLALTNSSEHIFVVEDEAGQIVGFASGGPIRDNIDGFDGELYLIYLLASAQGKGYGRGLITQVARQLKAAGLQAMMLWVLEHNRAGRSFYEALGGEPLLVTKPFMIEGIELTEVAYGWRDLNTLMVSGSR